MEQERTSAVGSVRTKGEEEVWEITTPGRVWIEVLDDRGHPKMVSVGGKIGAKLRIHPEDRARAQEGYFDREGDPFQNGLLVRVDTGAKDAERSDQTFGTEELMAIFELSGAVFQRKIDGLNEVNLRRVREMMTVVDASASQMAFIEETLEAKFKRGGDTPTYREMMAAREVTT